MRSDKARIAKPSNLLRQHVAKGSKSNCPLQRRFFSPFSHANFVCRKRAGFGWPIIFVIVKALSGAVVATEGLNCSQNKKQGVTSVHNE